MSEKVEIILGAKHETVNHVQPSVESEKNTKLHESSRGEIAFLSHILDSGISESLQEPHDVVNLFHVVGKFLIICLVPFRNLFEQPFVHFIWPTDKRRKAAKDECLSHSLGEEGEIGGAAKPAKALSHDAPFLL